MADNLMGLGEIAAVLGVSRARADQLARQVGFPSPAATLQAGRIWRRDDVERWARETGRVISFEHLLFDWTPHEPPLFLHGPLRLTGTPWGIAQVGPHPGAWMPLWYDGDDVPAPNPTKWLAHVTARNPTPDELADLLPLAIPRDVAFRLAASILKMRAPGG